MRKLRNFYARSEEVQGWITRNTWCDFCEEADLGLQNPTEYEEDGVTHISGMCNKCGATVTSVISEIDSPE